MSKKKPLNDWLKYLQSAFTAGTLVKLELLKPTPLAGGVKSVEARPILVKREKVLSFTTHHKTQDIVKNYPLPPATVLLEKMLPHQFTSARLHTQTADYYLSHQGGNWVLAEQPAKFTAAPTLAHDAAKQHLLKTTEAALPTFFQALGLTDANNQVLPSAQDKFRQINKYLEILDGLMKQLPKTATLRVLDMGAGKGYLTFALYHHLTATMGLQAEVVGVELRPELVALCNTIAVANNLTGLKFAQSSISAYPCQGAHIIIALHACDTATDDALAQAITAGAQLVVLAPCCHKQVRRELTRSLQNKPAHHPLYAMLQYGTYAERLAEMLTDTVRAHTLTLAGYQTNLFEFIGGEHTPKNVMITALKPVNPLSPAVHNKARTAVANLQATLGLTGLQLGAPHAVPPRP